MWKSGGGPRGQPWGEEGGGTWKGGSHWRTPKQGTSNWTDTQQGWSGQTGWGSGDHPDTSRKEKSNRWDDGKEEKRQNNMQEKSRKIALPGLRFHNLLEELYRNAENLSVSQIYIFYKPKIRPGAIACHEDK